MSTVSVPTSHGNRSRAHVHRNWLTYASVLLIAILVVGVPQVRHIFEFPTFTSAATSAGSVGFYIFAAILIVVYFLTGWWVVPPNLRIRWRVRTKSNRSDSTVAKKLRTRVWNQIDRHHRVTAAVSGFLGASLAVLSYFPNDIWKDFMEPSVVLLFGLLLLAVAVVMLLWERFDERTRRLLVRVLVSLLALNLAGELVWFLAEHTSVISFRYYSLWAMLHTMFCVLLFARVVDYWQAYSPLPIRTVAVVLVLLTASRFGPTTVGKLKPASDFYENASLAPSRTERRDRIDPKTLPLLGLAVSDSWLAHLKMRLDAIPKDGPIVFVAASGGGSRAALFTAMVLEDLSRQPVHCEGHSDYRIDDHILLISSVSGGTLASACYVDDGYAHKTSDESAPHGPKNFFPEETMALMVDALPTIQGRPWYEGFHHHDQWTEWWRAAEACCAPDEESRWFFQSTFVDDMCTDFMAPLLRGVLHPLNDRGQSTMRFWQRRFRLSATNLDWHRRIANRLLQMAGPSPQPPKLKDWPPLLLCNVSEVERGNRAIIGFPPLPPDLLTFDIEAPHFPREWIALATGEQGVTDISEVNLAEATRLSASFPWGFPVGRVEIPQRTSTGGHRPDVRFVDGAVADNTGIDSLRYVVDRLREWANRSGSSAQVATAPQRRYSVAKQIVEELMQRGIVILEIDSGSKPQSPGIVARGLSGLLEPIAALENASYAHASSDVSTHLGVIETELPFRRARQLRWRIERLASPIWQDGSGRLDGQNALSNVERITVICNHDDNVMTAWALGPRDKANVFLRFAAGSAKMRDQWEDYLDRYYRERSEVSSIDEQLRALENSNAQGRAVPPEHVEKLIEKYRILVAGSQTQAKLRQLDVAVEAQIAQKMPPSEAQLAQAAARIQNDQSRQLSGTLEVIPLPPVDDEPPLIDETKKVNTAREMGPAQLKLDYSRVGASVKKIQQKASEENKKAIQKLNALE